MKKKIKGKKDICKDIQKLKNLNAYEKGVSEYYKNFMRRFC